MCCKKLKKKKKQMFAFFRRLSSLHYLCFTNKEILQNKILGLDGAQKKLFIVEDKKHKYDSRVIDLFDVRSCKLKKVYNAINANNFKKDKLHNYLNTITLELGFKNGNKPFALEFYKNATHRLHQSQALETKAKQWGVILSNLLSATEQKIA